MARLSNTQAQALMMAQEIGLSSGGYLTAEEMLAEIDSFSADHFSR
jgi:hypothetical protein